MPITPTKHAPFDCLICEDRIEPDRWSWTPGQPVPPVCNRCAQAYGRAIGGYGDLNPDRRLLRRVWALAEFLECLAYRKQHRMPHGPA